MRRLYECRRNLIPDIKYVHCPHRLGASSFPLQRKPQSLMPSIVFVPDPELPADQLWLRRKADKDVVGVLRARQHRHERQHLQPGGRTCKKGVQVGQEVRVEM